MNKGMLSILLAICGILTTVFASDTLSITTLNHSSLTVYDVDQGLLTSGLREVFVDNKGRLWLNPYRDQDFQQDLGFFHFDGEKSHHIKPEALKIINQKNSLFLHGVSSAGDLFGSDLSRSFAFILNPETQEGQVFEFGQEERIMRVLADDASNYIYVWTRTPENHAIYRLSNADKVLLGEIPAADAYLLEKDFLPPTVITDGRLWFFDYLHGFFGFDLDSRTFKTYSWPNLWPDLLPDAEHINMVVDGKGQLLFFLQIDQGFFQFDPTTGTLAPETNLNQFMSTLIFHEFDGIEMLSDEQGNVLLLIDYINSTSISNRAGYLQAIVLLDPDSKLFDLQPIAQAIATAGRYSTTNSNFAFGKDFRDEITFATGGGLVVVELPTNLPIRTQILSKGCRGMAELNKEKILALTDIGRIDIVPISNISSSITLEEWTQCPQPYKLPAFAQFIQPTPDQLWFPTQEGELVWTNLHTNECKAYAVGQSFHKFGLIPNNGVALVDLNNVVYRYDLTTSSLHSFLYNGQPLNLGGTANEVYIDDKGLAWIASLNGLWAINFQSGEVQHWGRKEGFPDDRILCIQETKNGALWLGTFSAGVLVFDPIDGIVQQIDQENGLSNNTVVGILSDNQGDFWVSTFNRINVITTEGEVLLKLSEEDGLAHNEFNRFSYLKLSNGELAFGGVNGITILNPKGIKKVLAPKDDLQIYLSSLRYYDQQKGADIVYRDHLSNPELITLPPTHRYLYLDFALSSYSALEKCNFSYRIKKSNKGSGNSEEKWTSIRYNSELSLNDLSPGRYDLQVRGTDHKGRVTKQPITIPIHVKEFFYKTWWFYALCALFLLTLVIAWIKRLQREKIQLEAEVQKRTRQIREDKVLIEKQAEELQKLDELKSRFFTNISHEFRTPLTIISGMVTQMKNDHKQWGEKGLELIQRNSRQLLSLINQILDLRKLESGSLKVNLIQGNIIAYLYYIADSFKSIAQSKGISIHFQSSLPELEMDYDPDKILQILSNLLTNAIKYTSGVGDIFLEVDHLNGQSEEQLLIQIRDTGQGIPEKTLPYIFDRFYQVDPNIYQENSQKPQGSGVGLALTSELIELLHGSIDVASTLGVGTTFTIHLPINRKAETKAPSVMPAVTNDETIPKMESKPSVFQISDLSEVSELPRLLIVEDNPDVRIYLAACLQKHYRLLMAENGQEGIDLAVEEVPDLIVSDVMMPVADGFTLCETLKNDERTSHVPIVLLTAKADFASKIEGLRKGADAYLPKPFEEEELLVRLQQLFLQRKKLQERYRGLSPIDPGSVSEEFQIEDAFVLKLRQTVLEHLVEDDFGLTQLYRAMGVSRTQLHNKVKALTGLSSSAFVKSIRLHKAKELLQTTDLNISEVGYEVGISNPAYFSRIFSEAFGESPREIRNKIND
jgi:signal transduction histidine kinase/DNA-binding response OmpR family regulator/streptogramin lyase